MDSNPIELEDFLENETLVQISKLFVKSRFKAESTNVIAIADDLLFIRAAE